MKKHLTLKFLALSAMLMLGNVAANATARDNTNGPADNTAVGATIKIGDQIGLVTYRVTGWDATNDFYTVKITGFDADGLDALKAARAEEGKKVTLRIPVTFEEKFGEKKFKYAVTMIEDGLIGATKQSFYGLTEVDTLIFVGTGYNGVGLDKFQYTVGTKAFYGCTNMKKLEFTENCRSIGTYAFQNTAIREFVIPKQCETVDEYAFYNCKNLKTVSVASGNTAMHILGTHVFGNSALQTLDLRNAEQLWQITGEPFMYNLSIINDVLKTVYLPTEVKAINTAFKNCTALTNMYGLQETSLGEIINRAFNKNGVLTARADAACIAGQGIIDDAFYGCRSLTRLDIPNCDVFIAPFEGCAALDTLTFIAGYSKEIGKTAVANTNLYGTFLTTNALYSTADQSALTTIEFKGAFKGIIAADAFVGSLALNKVDFKGQLQNGATINAAFTDVTSLTEVIFNGVNTKDADNNSGAVAINANAFQNTGIAAVDFKGITLDGGVVGFDIAANAFSDCAALADVKTGDINIKNTGTFNIAGDAFINNPVLAKVTFGTTAFTANGFITIADNAFATGNEALAAVEWGNITSTTTSPNAGYNSTITIGGGATVFGDTKALATVKFGTIDAGALTINAEAFRSSGLSSVQFGNITTPLNLNSAVTIGQNAFASAFIPGVSEPEAKTVKFGTISENRTGATANQMTFHILDGAFAAESLKEVEFGAITAFDVDIDGRVVAAPGINKGAFESANLQKVKFGNITASRYSNSTFDIADFAFNDGKAAAKKVEIGNIVDNTSTMTAVIGANAFEADSLSEVKIGNMTATAVTIGVSGFSGMALTKVELGNIGAGVTINDEAFANTNNTDALTENVTMGTLAAATFVDTDGNGFSYAFKGPQFEGSALNVTIGAISGAATLLAKTFVAPEAASGIATYTVSGNVTASLNAPENTFIGAQKYELGAPVENTTNVWFKGNYTSELANQGVFTNVNDLKIAVANEDGDAASAMNYGVAGDLKAFKGAKTVTIGDVTTSIVANTAGYTDDIVEITFLKNVAVANAIGTFNSTKVRKIEFANVADTDVKVAAGAVSAAAFKLATDQAIVDKENISVIYREEQPREAEVIFARNAFTTNPLDNADDDDLRPVTLYTSTWAKANTFEAADVEQNDIDGHRYVFRLGFSESKVAPGEPIIASVIKKEGNTYGYAKLYIPKGVNMKYKVPAKYDATSDKNGVQLYYGRIDNSNNKIYMYSLPVIDDYYWIDATDVDQAFVLRTNSDIEPSATITAETVTNEDLATFAAGDPSEYYFFGAALAVQNQLRYNTAEIANQELRNNPEFAGRDVYVMANPLTAAGGFAFAKFNKDATYTKVVGDHEIGDLRWLSAKSLYIVGKVNAAAPNLEVVFEGDDNFDANTTGIDTVKNAEQNSDAIFNLQGIRVNNAQKGIYIMNGKKFVVK